MVSERETLSKTGIIKGKEKGPLGEAFPGKLLLSTSPSPLAPPSDKHFEVLVRTLTKNVMVINTIILLFNIMKELHHLQLVFFFT